MFLLESSLRRDNECGKHQCIDANNENVCIEYKDFEVSTDVDVRHNRPGIDHDIIIPIMRQFGYDHINCVGLCASWI